MNLAADTRIEMRPPDGWWTPDKWCLWMQGASGFTACYDSFDELDGATEAIARRIDPWYLEIRDGAGRLIYKARVFEKEAIFARTHPVKNVEPVRLRPVEGWWKEAQHRPAVWLIGTKGAAQLGDWDQFNAPRLAKLTARISPFHIEHRDAFGKELTEHAFHDEGIEQAFIAAHPSVKNTGYSTSKLLVSAYVGAAAVWFFFLR